MTTATWREVTITPRCDGRFTILASMEVGMDPKRFSCPPRGFPLIVQDVGIFKPGRMREAGRNRIMSNPSTECTAYERKRSCFNVKPRPGEDIPRYLKEEVRRDLTRRRRVPDLGEVKHSLLQGAEE